MAYIAVDPISKKPKEYKNSAEFLQAVEKAQSKEKPKESKKDLSLAEAEKRLRAETGVDTRPVQEKQESLISQIVGEVLARQSATGIRQAPKIAKSEGHEAREQSEQPQRARRCTGPVTHARALSAAEAQRRLAGAGLKI